VIPSAIPIPVPVELNRDWVDFALLAVTTLGVVATFFIGFLTYRATKKANEANARATELQIAAIGRLADREPATPAGGIRWSIAKTGAHTYELRNSGSATAYDVTIEEISESPSADTDLYPLRSEPISLDPDASLPFSIERRLSSPPVTLALITWHKGDGIAQRAQRVIR